MLKNYFIIAVRTLNRYRTYSLINIFGLTIGLASFFILFFHVKYQWNYDRYHNKSDRIYRIINRYEFSGTTEISTSSPFPLAAALRQEYPDKIEKIVRFFNFQMPQTLIGYDDNYVAEKRFFFADSTVFEVFDIEFIKGNPETALNSPFSVVLTESTAKRYFGNNPAIGKKLKLLSSHSLTVTGIVKDIPAQSHFIFDFLASFSTVREMYRGSEPETWVWNPCWTYILLKKGVSKEEMNQALAPFPKKYFHPVKYNKITTYLQPLTDIHLKSHLDFEIEPNHDIKSVIILATLGFSILLIAMINFKNLSTASSSRRAKEIGVKKVMGASRKQLIFQFLGESVIMSFGALFFALALIEISIPLLNHYLQSDVLKVFRFSFSNISLLIIITFFTGIISGLYPAFFLSSLRPVRILKGTFKKGEKSSLPRKLLVILQIMISTILIIGTITAYHQQVYLSKKHLGFHKKNILILTTGNTRIVPEFEKFKNDLLQIKGVRNVTASDYVIGTDHNNHEFRHDQLDDGSWEFYPALVIRYDFIKTFDIKLLAGRTFSDKNENEPQKAIVINRSLAKKMGWTPEQALGKRFSTLMGNEKIVGVVEDFHIKSLHNPLNPFVLNLKENKFHLNYLTKYTAIRLKDKADKQAAIAEIKKVWQQHTLAPFDYEYLEDRLNRLYADEKITTKISAIFTLIAILIAGLGLVGLVTFLNALKTREIGIRKALGASCIQIIVYLLKDLIKLTLIANALAVPAAYISVKIWLNAFAYSVEPNIWIFVFSILLSELFTFLMVFIQTYKAARTNPVNSLRYE